MKPETAVLNIHGQHGVYYGIYTEFYRAVAAQKTIILVNGSMATTASFAQTVRYLQPHFNVVLYDQPYAGRSRAHNAHDLLLSKAQEANILLQLIQHFRADCLLSFSWGAPVALLALAQHPASIERAVINSFAPGLNAPMQDYLARGEHYLQNCDRQGIAHLVNDTIGKHLPSLFKRFNYRHVSSLAEYEYRQMHQHVGELREFQRRHYVSTAQAITVPVLFVNGELDEYTSTQDARGFAAHVRHCQFASIAGAGHFLDAEHKQACADTERALLHFLQPAPSISRSWLFEPDVRAAIAV